MKISLAINFPLCYLDIFDTKVSKFVLCWKIRRNSLDNTSESELPG